MRDHIRKDPRLKLIIQVFYDGMQGKTKDISINGTFIKSGRQSNLQPVGSDISLTLEFPGARNLTGVTGTVVHHGREDGIGVWFKKIDERKKEFIRKFLLTHR